MKNDDFVIDTLWREKVESENPKDESEEPFIPAKLVEKKDKAPLLHVDL